MKKYYIYTICSIATVLITSCTRASDCNQAHCAEDIPLLTTQTVKDGVQKSVDSPEELKVSVHHLPQTNEECMNARAMFWEGEKYYQTQRYEESIAYFLNAERFYVPDCLKYLYKFIENEHYFMNLKKVSPDSIERIKSQLPQNVELEKLERMYQERFLKQSFFTGISPLKIQEKNRSGTRSSMNRQYEGSKASSILSILTVNSISLFKNMFLDQTADFKED